MNEALLAFLREQRHRIVRRITVATPPTFDPTYGHGSPGSEDIEVVDFEALLDAIDEFGEQLRASRGQT